MPQIITIKNLTSPELDVYARLTESELRHSYEAQNGIFVAESVLVIKAAIESGYEPISFLSEPRHVAGKASALLEAWPSVPVYVAEKDILSQLTGYALTRGVLACLKRRPMQNLNKVCIGRRVAVLESIADSTNVGAMFRSAAALGIDGIILSPKCCDPLCRRSLRVSMGSVFKIPWTYAEGVWPNDFLAFLKKNGFVSLALALDDFSLSLDDPRLKNAEKLAFFLGTEGDGLSRAVIAGCDHTVKIPMSHGVNSLNVATSAAIAFWELRVANCN